MSAPSPPGDGQRWPQLLAYVVNDDDRTRRANLLLWRVTVCLLAAGTVLLATVALLARAPGWYTGVGGSVVALFLSSGPGCYAGPADTSSRRVGERLPR